MDDVARGALPPDQALVRIALRGDQAARKELTDRLCQIPKILAAIDRRRGNRLRSHDLEDLSQQTLARVWEKLDRFDGRGTLVSWVFGFCVLEYAHWCRRRTSLTLQEEPTEESKEIADLELIEGLLHQLGPPEAEIIRSKVFEDLTFQEISAALGIPEATAKTRYYRGLRWMRRRLEGRLEEVVG